MRMNFSEDHMLVRRVKTEHDWEGFPSEPILGVL